MKVLNTFDNEVPNIYYRPKRNDATLADVVYGFGIYTWELQPWKWKCWTHLIRKGAMYSRRSLSMHSGFSFSRKWSWTLDLTMIVVGQGNCRTHQCNETRPTLAHCNTPLWCDKYSYALFCYIYISTILPYTTSFYHLVYLITHGAGELESLGKQHEVKTKRSSILMTCNPASNFSSKLESIINIDHNSIVNGLFGKGNVTVVWLQKTVGSQFTWKVSRKYTP